jgi:TPR repeat protein
MKRLVGQTAALHIAFWQYDPWYRRAWFVWPQAAAILLAGWLLTDRGAVPIGKWAKPADCTNASSPGCAATQRVMFSWVDELSRPTIANQATVIVDRSAFRSSAAADRPKLAAALGAYYRRDWPKAIEILKSATAGDPNVQYITALALLIPSTTDHVRDAQALLRTAAAAGHRQAAGVLGRTLIVGAGGLPKDEAQGRKLIEDGAAAGDTYAMRLAAAGYLNREFAGSYDSVKAVDLVRKAADAGDAVAMAQFAYCIKTGRGGLVRDEGKVVDYLRRSAEAGYLEAQFTLGRWFTQRYANREIEDPSEGIKWLERAYQRGYSFSALVDLAYAHRYARAMPWFDTKRSFELLQLCAPYKYLHCHYWLARAYHDGAGTPRDLVKAYAHYTVAQQLGRKEAASELQKLDGVLQPAAKTTATELAASISGSLRPTPWAIVLESPETEAAGSSPWAAPFAQPAAVPSAPSPQSSADWDTCKKNDLEPAIAACARLIGSGITGKDLGLAHFFQGWNYNEKKQYRQAITEYNKAIELGANLASAHNNRGVAYKELGNLDAALRDYDEAVRLDPSDAMAYQNRAYVYLLRNRLDEAIADASAAIGLDAKRPRTFWIRAGAYEEKAQWSEVVSDCTTALGLDPKFGDCLYRRGWAYFKLGKNDIALADLNEALRLDPQWSAVLYSRGFIHASLGDFDAAARDYDSAAARGNVYAMNDLGLLYLQGKGVARDYAEAFRWFEKAQNGGNALAMNNIGFLYERGQGVPQDYAEARRWYEKAAEKGNALAMNNLGQLYRTGQGVPKNPAEAKRWFEKAASIGDAAAMNRLGVMYHNGEGMPQNYGEAFRWFEKAAARGEPSAMNWLGVMYHNAEGVAQNYSEAWRWYEKAAALGDAWAMFNMGAMYELGEGVSRSKSEARNWYQKAAAHGHPDANRKLQALR